MDPWRRNLNRLNSSRQPSQGWQVRRADAAKWGKITLLCAAAVAIWLMLQNRPVRLDGSAPAVTGADAGIDDTGNGEMRTDGATARTEGEGLFQQERYAEALPLLLPLAEAGNSDAQCMVGKILAEGRGGVGVDLIEGAKWLDLCLRDPDGLNRSDEEASELMDRLIATAGWDIVGEGKYRAFQWQQAASNTELGEPGSASELVLRDLAALDADGAFALGADLNAGRNMPVDYAKALQAFKHASELGLKEATFNVGLAYYVGKGVKADPGEARKWLDRAADAGFAEAALLLGVMAVRGHGMTADRDLSLSYLERADELGHPDAAAIRAAVAVGLVPN
jgi:TPR repeat protein